MMFDVLGGKRVYTYSGIMLTTFKAPGTEWVSSEMHIGHPIPGLPDGKGFAIETTAPFATLNTVDQDAATSAGWALDNVAIHGFAGAVSRDVDIVFNLAVRGRSALVLRIGYLMQILGRVVDI